MSADLNWFPAILIAGSPNCGKSVLAFTLTQRLRELGISHYLLRTAPDGEGNWFLEVQDENAEIVRQLRTRNKRPYSHALVQHMTEAISQRRLPLLVDIGGQPQGEQYSILRACTHSILLYRSEEQRCEWLPRLADLAPVAELRSDPGGNDQIEAHSPLQGVIAGLERDAEKRKTGPVFAALLERVASICRYSAEELENRYRPLAPFAFHSELDLARRLGLEWQGARPRWRPEDLSAALVWLPAGEDQALYGYGPVWLAAAAAINAWPGDFALFDATFGWMQAPEAEIGGEPTVKVQETPWESRAHPGLAARLVEISVPQGILEPKKIILPPVELGGGIILSGKLPRWAFAALARKLAQGSDWLAVHVPSEQIEIVIFSHNPLIKPGGVIRR